MARESPRTTKLYDRTRDVVSLDEVERVVFYLFRPHSPHDAQDNRPSAAYLCELFLPALFCAVELRCIREWLVGIIGHYRSIILQNRVTVLAIMEAA